ncbi:MAG: DUF5067 domain-containing protein [Eubacteriales bacterium]|nr:DUF5067 domain-containing protein [Eubacteriales bacterium]
MDRKEMNEDISGKKGKKKKRIWVVGVAVILLLAVAGGGGYYFMQRLKPEKAVEQFLDGMQKMDFASMEGLLQSNDLSALDNADIRDDAYSEFFKGINEKMSYKIVKNDFDIQNGTAQVTARIKYIDGSDIYKETISEFLRQIVSTAFSGEELSEVQTQQKLASILSDKAGAVEDKFSEADITYPLIKAGGEWKIVSLDDETVKIMSANFKSVEDEINQSLDVMDSGADSAEGQAPDVSQGDTIDMTTEKFTIHYTQHRIGKDFAGNPCLLLYYDYTNNGTAASSAMVDVNIRAYQNDKACDAAIPESNEDAIDNFMAEIQPGATVNVCQAFSLADNSDVTLRAGEAFSFGGGETTSQILKVQ